MELRFTVPIYYTNKFKTKKNKNILIGMNWYRGAHFILSNKIKQYYKTLIPVTDKKFAQATIHYDIYIKRKGTDGGNIRSVIEKFVLD